MTISHVRGTSRRTGAALIVAALLAGAGCTPGAGGRQADPPSAEAAATRAYWAGRWSGSWEDECRVAIEVSNVDVDSAYVEYIWSVCPGNASGSMVNTSARIEGDVMTVPLGGGIRLTFVRTGENTLDGTFERHTTGQFGRSVFRRDEG